MVVQLSTRTRTDQRQSHETNSHMRFRRTCSLRWNEIFNLRWYTYEWQTRPATHNTLRSNTQAHARTQAFSIPPPLEAREMTQVPDPHLPLS